MRDFRDAKAMAHTLRAALEIQGLKLSVGQSLELIAKLFGVADWNTLSAAINAGPDLIADLAPQASEDSGGGQAAERVRFSETLEATLYAVVRLAGERRHEHVTLEHLLLGLSDDADAAKVMTTCGVDLARLKDEVSTLLEHEAPAGAPEPGETPRPTAAFQRVIQRAVLHVQASGRSVVTGAQVLVAIFSEQESRAAQLLEAHPLRRVDAVNVLMQASSKPGGSATA